MQYATATLKVLYTYSGWSRLNYVLNDVKDPVRTLKIATPLGFSICAVLYVMANISYFAYVQGHLLHGDAFPGPPDSECDAC